MAASRSPPGAAAAGPQRAGLRYLHKPVELIILKAREHVITNPAVRLTSQDLTVDWFWFWLQDYEDPGTAKAEQYKRWRELRKLQQQQNSPANQPN